MTAWLLSRLAVLAAATYALADQCDRLADAVGGWGT